VSLLIPLILFGVGVAAVVFVAVADVERHGAAFFGLLLALAILGPLACIAYGAYVWLRTETWGTITVLDALRYLEEPGVSMQFFLKQVSWQGVQRLSDWYLGSNIGLTLFVVPLALILFQIKFDKAIREDKSRSS